ncbi:MAG TPA: ABC transporter permease subunit [Planctomycetota bacterium]|nr:ABC transporter permease subunit [Planctomycetota bacterium]
MTGFLATFRAEARDLFRHPLAWAGIVASAAAAFIFARYAPHRDNGYTVYGAALHAGAQIAGFFLLGLSAISISGERARGTVRFLLPRPVARPAFVLGKATALAALALAFVAATAGVAWAGARDGGFSDVKAEAPPGEDEDGFHYVEEEVVDPAFLAATMRRRVALATLLVLPALLTATGLGLLVSSVLASPAAAVLVAIGVALPLNYLPEVMGLAPGAARTLPFRAASDYLGSLVDFGRHLSTAEWPHYGALHLLGALIAGIGLPLLGAVFFSRVDLTD